MMECLNCLSYVLEYAPFDKTVGKPTEEILNYLKLTFVMDPLSTLYCVQALLRCIFATNSANQNIMSNETIPNSSIGEKHASKIYDRFALNTGCYLVKTQLKLNLFQNWHRHRFSICFPTYI